VALHILRHTHASQLITSGMDIVTLSRCLEHSSLAITLTVYGHLLSPQHRAADIMEAAFANEDLIGSKMVANAVFFSLAPEEMLVISAGRVAEWFKAAVLKTARARRALVGSNPTPSANALKFLEKPCEAACKLRS
jgi:Phage integrase family